MTFPKMLVMRNTPDGMIWQAYRVENQLEEDILTKNARLRGFIVQHEEEFYTSETSPGWRDTNEWRECLEKQQGSPV